MLTFLRYVTEKWFQIYISCFVRLSSHIISYIYIFAILIFCYFYKGCSLRPTGPKSGSLRLSFQVILLEIASNSDFISIRFISY